MAARWHRLYLRVAATALVLSPGFASAAVATGRSPGYDLAMKFVNFGILAAILFFALRKPVRQGLADRQEDIKKALEEARKAKEAAEAKYEEYKRKVANLEQEVQQVHADFKAEGERQRDRIVAEAKEAAASIRRQAEAAGANEVKRATDELRAETAKMALQMAEELLAKAYTPEDQKKALQLTIRNVEDMH